MVRSEKQAEMLNTAIARAKRDAYKLQARTAKAQALEAKFKSEAAGQADYLRPKLHITPPFGRLNDPNGLHFLDGTWHAFYQHTPLFPEKGVFWRHATSSDLLHWEDQGSALAPVDFFDTHGCYSGCAIVLDDSTVELYYTGNVKDDAGNREAYQAVAVSTDGSRTFTKFPTSATDSPVNPLIAGPAPGFTAHYRDPDLHQHDSGWMMLLGAQRENETGAIVRYDSADRLNWEFMGEITFRPAPGAPAEVTDQLAELNALGYMIECPILVRLNERSSGEVKDVLLICPQGLAASDQAWWNTDNLAYLVGRLDGTDFYLDQSMREVDGGFEIYAPQVFSNAGERQILLAWMGNPAEDDQPSLSAGWVHALTLPRELHLENGFLVQQPVAEYREFIDQIPVALRQLLPGEPLNYELGGQAHFSLQVDLSAQDFGLGSHPQFNLEFRGSAGRVTLSLDATGIELDRSQSAYPGVYAQRRVPLAGETSLTGGFELLVDGSTAELFIDGGKQVLTSRFFVGEPESVTLELSGVANPQQVTFRIF